MNQTPHRVSLGRGLASCEIIDGRLRLSLNNTTAAIEDARLQIGRFLEPNGLDERVINRLEVVLEELIFNTVRHGFTPGSGQSILLTVEAGQGAVVLTFEDDGAPFNPLDVPAPAPFTTIDTAKVGGLGIALVRKMASSLEHQRLAPGQARRTVAGRMFDPCNRLTVSVAT